MTLRGLQTPIDAVLVEPIANNGFRARTVLSFSEAAIHRSRALQVAKLNVRKMELCIAAIALEHQAIVVTRNVRDFERVPNLVVEDWSK